MSGVVLGVLAILASVIFAIFWVVPGWTFVDAQTAITGTAAEHHEARR